jgi:hypothetical protein
MQRRRCRFCAAASFVSQELFSSSRFIVGVPSAQNSFSCSLVTCAFVRSSTSTPPLSPTLLPLASSFGPSAASAPPNPISNRTLGSRCSIFRFVSVCWFLRLTCLLAALGLAPKFLQSTHLEDIKAAVINNIHISYLFCIMRNIATVSLRFQLALMSNKRIPCSRCRVALLRLTMSQSAAVLTGDSQMVRFIRTQLQQENMQRFYGTRPRAAIFIPEDRKNASKFAPLPGRNCRLVRRGSNAIQIPHIIAESLM